MSKSAIFLMLTELLIFKLHFMDIIEKEVASQVMDKDSNDLCVFINPQEKFCRDENGKILTIAELQKHSVHYDAKQWTKDLIAKSMPVARRLAVKRLRNGDNIADFEDEILEIDSIERRLYLQMNNTFIHHINIHGYAEKAVVYVSMLKNVKDYNHNYYHQVISKMRKDFVNNNRKIDEINEKNSPSESDVILRNLLQNFNKSLDYLISKTTEFMHKVNDIGNSAYQMIVDGKHPDLQAWSLKIQINDALFEENKQFLSQTISHFNSLLNYNARLGAPEISLLLNQKEGCRQEKLYHQVEELIIRIYNSLPNSTKEEKREKAKIYKEICTFVLDVIPLTGRISIDIIYFIFDRGFLSNMSRDLLLKIEPRINSIGMTALFKKPLQQMFEQTYQNYLSGNVKSSDYYVFEIAIAYGYKDLCTAAIKKRLSVVQANKNSRSLTSSDLKMIELALHFMPDIVPNDLKNIESLRTKGRKCSNKA